MIRGARRGLVLVALLLLPAAAAAGPAPAAARLYTRVDGAVVRAVVEIEIHPRRHLYHSEVGGEVDEFGEGYPGRPLRVVPRSGGVEWSEPRFPEAERYRDEKLGNWAYIHRGTIRVYLVGRVVDPGWGGEVEMEVSGLTCSTVDLSCIPLSQVVVSGGSGPDRLFEGFPELPPPRPEAGGSAVSNSWK